MGSRQSFTGRGWSFLAEYSLAQANAGSAGSWLGGPGAQQAAQHDACRAARLTRRRCTEAGRNAGPSARRVCWMCGSLSRPAWAAGPRGFGAAQGILLAPWPAPASSWPAPCRCCYRPPRAAACAAAAAQACRLALHRPGTPLAWLRLVSCWALAGCQQGRLTSPQAGPQAGSGWTALPPQTLPQWLPRCCWAAPYSATASPAAAGVQWRPSGGRWTAALGAGLGAALRGPAEARCLGRCGLFRTAAWCGCG